MTRAGHASHHSLQSRVPGAAVSSTAAPAAGPSPSQGGTGMNVVRTLPTPGVESLKRFSEDRRRLR